jgi:RNA polymerase sigma factor (sigma-70 family)
MQAVHATQFTEDMLPEAANSAPIDINTLYKTHHKHVLLFVRRYVRDANDAEDVTQSAFLEATRCAANFSHLSKPSTWLFGIALNMARNHIRKQLPTGTFCDVEDEANEQEDPFGDPAKLVEARELLGKSLNLVGTMSEELQATFSTVIDTDQTYDLAAKELGIPIGTVRSRLSRIRAQLRCLTEPRAECDLTANQMA